jgi:hypothetical protein
MVRFGAFSDIGALNLNRLLQQNLPEADIEALFADPPLAYQRDELACQEEDSATF